MSSGDERPPTDDEVFTIVAVPTVADSRPPQERDLGEGTRMADRYAITRRIGKGGMGEVMAARDEQIGRDVAIKRMKAAAPSERAIARFLREATIQGRLEHPAIVPVHEIGRDAEGLPFFVMKKLQGTTLAKLLEGDKERYTLQRVLRAFAEVCLAVEFAHVRGIVHRDLKPDNIILGDYGEVYVIDWGVAKVIGEDGGDAEGEFDDVSGSGDHATAVGTAIGTPGYMSPEQARGMSHVDGRADIYTLGCVLFEILAGETLHARGRDGMVSTVYGTDARPSIRSPERRIAPELDALCVEATQLDPARRVPTARELGDRVLQFLDGDRDLEKRRELGRDHLE
ncbi:MAG: serine/threonine protein kinase, partial [Deltaproteobacteria bacterium]|nr:serine/threonine protein kinase [Deltaproteobacteria bacterium]